MSAFVDHPILAAVSDIRAALKSVAGANPTFLSTSEKAAALRELVAAEAQLVELRLRVLAGAGDVAESTGAKDAAGWLAHQTRSRYADARADLALAGALDRERPWTPTPSSARKRTSWAVRLSSGPRSWAGSGAGSST